MKHLQFAKTVMNNLMHKPTTRLYPSVRRDCGNRTRGHIRINQDDCIYCGICAKKCPTNAIEVDRVDHIWGIDRYNCIQCGACTEQCPKKCLYMEKEYAKAATGKTKDVYKHDA